MKSTLDFGTFASAALVLSALSVPFSSLLAQGTAFSYQGRLMDAAGPANGSYHFRFTLFDSLAGAGAIGSPLTPPLTPVTNGLFTVTLDFGPGIFTGPNRWLQIEVRTNDDAAQFVTLVPRQPLNPSPYAIFASTASNLSGTLPVAQLEGTPNAAATFTGGLTGDVTGTQGATVVSVVGGQAAAYVASGVSAANAATSTNVPGTIVKRDASGNISAGFITLEGTMNFPPWQVIVNSGSTTVLNSDGGLNFFAGLSAGNLTTVGGANTAVGSSALTSDTSGSYNTAIGFVALVSNLYGSWNTASGFQALLDNTTGSHNTANGADALAINTSGELNTATGYGAIFFNTNGSSNTASGAYSLYRNTNGSGNIAIGARAGFNTFGDNNILVGNEGASDDNGTIRLGTTGTHTNTFIAGISAATAASGVAVYVNSDGRLGTLTSSARFKEDIQSMDDASSALYSLRPVTFHYKPELDPQAIPQFGLVAEEVEKVNPDLVARDDKNQVYTVRYEAVNAMLLNEFLKEHRKVEEQNTEIQTLKERLEKLEQRVGQQNAGAQ